ncbi:uncharacterized protein LOC108843571 [Raphanus sativus]|uniref:Uncharacterized protein LOC108843571 n=1 Tax=Raphanus sativus TaxID=3726 RepID=A0A6J0MIH9_RAPSA|nr:uncharacterized protein LOC108843571 [Raphanus sativus]
MAAKQVLIDGLHRKIGTGAETKAWKDVWLPTNPPRPAIPRDENTETGLMVHHLIDFERKEWNVNLVQQLVADVDVPRVLSLKISRTGRQDTYTWSHTNSGNYTVRSGHAVAVKQRKQDETAAILEPMSGFVASASKLKERHYGNDAARNEKCFNAKDVTPLDTLQLATSEAESWRIAQIVETNAEGGKPAEDTRQVIDHRDTDCKWICQVDASWKDKNKGTELGFILFEDRRVRLLGIKHYDKVASPLHAEAEALSWALKETKKIGASEVIVELDCQQLVRLINKPQE